MTNLVLLLAVFGMLRNPTYAELVAFLNKDRTNTHTYSEEYTCWDFACEMQRNAQRAGYRAGFVYVGMRDSAHAIVAFETVDRGLVFVEPQIDRPVVLQEGVSYYSWIFGPTMQYMLSYDSTVLSWEVDWNSTQCQIHEARDREYPYDTHR